MAIERQRLHSTAIIEWAYDDQRELLDVLFTDSTAYRFRVDSRTWARLQSSFSKGEALNSLVLRYQRGSRLF